MWDVPIGRDGGAGEDKPSHSANAKTGRLSDLNLTQSELECSFAEISNTVTYRVSDYWP